MIGKIFGKWTALSEVKIEKPGKHFECICECGNVKIIPGTTLRAGRSKQCPDCQYKKLYDTREMIGRKFGRWLIVRFIDIHRQLKRYETICECGYKSKHIGAELRAGKSTMCINCHNMENAKINTKHGMHETKIYKVWTSMIQRCINKNAPFYERYGGRGIIVCDRWRRFENFIKDMGMREEGLELDRINNDGNYEPSNCRWVTHKENCNNRSNKKK